MCLKFKTAYSPPLVGVLDPTRGSPSTPATTTSAFALVDTVRLERLVFYLWRLLLQPLASSIVFGSREFASTTSHHDIGDFYYAPRKTFAASATNPGQERLWRDHGGLVEPDGFVRCS